MATATVESLAKLLDITPRRIQQLVAAKVLPKPVSRGQYEIVPSVIAYIRHLRAIAHGDSGDLLVEKTRLARAQAAKTELETARLQSTLVPAVEVARCWGAMITAARAKLLALPARTAPLLQPLSTEGAIEQLLTDRLMEALAELAQIPFVDSSGLDHPSPTAVAPATNDDREPMERG